MENIQNKRILVYLPVTCGIVCLLGLLQAVDVSKVDLYYYFAVILAIAIGSAHAFAIDKLSGGYHFGACLCITIAVMVLAALADVIVYRYASLNPGFLTFIIAFVIPYLSWHAYLQFLKTS